MYDKKV